MFIIDSHTHLHFDHYQNDLSEVLENASQVGVKKMITIGTDISSSLQSLQLAQKYPQYLIAAAGFHPTDCMNASEEDFDKLKRLIQNHSEFAAVGEVGLDLYWKDVPLTKQLPVFEAMQYISEELDKPMIIHNRDALPEMRDYFKSFPPKRKNPGVMHSFAGNIDDARFYLDLGFYISFTGVITFKNFKQQEVVKYIPAERLLLETDAPFLTPVPYRGQRNEPAYLIHTLNKLAEIKEMEVDILADITLKNTLEMFQLDSK